MGYSEKGTVIELRKAEQVTEKFKKQLLVVEVEDGQYKNPFAVEFGNDKCDLLNKVKVGDNVEVFFNVRSRAWKDKYFTSLSGWKVDLVTVGQEASGPAPAMDTSFTNAPAVDVVTGKQIFESNDDEQDDLPF